MRDVIALWIAARDRRVMWSAKLVAGAVAGYALSPLDLIPDFIPVLGLLDDLILVPIGIWFAVRLIPPALMDAFRAEASRAIQRPKSPQAAAFIVIIWVAALAGSGWWLLT